VFGIPVVNQTQHEQKNDMVGVEHSNVQCIALPTNELGAMICQTYRVGPVGDNTCEDSSKRMRP